MTLPFSPSQLADYCALRRSIFHLKTDQPPNKLRHDIVVSGDTIIRHSRLANPDLAMWVERDVVTRVSSAGVRVLRLAIGQDEKSTYHAMPRANGVPLADIPAGKLRQAAFYALGQELAIVHRIDGRGAGFVYPSDARLAGVHKLWSEHLFAKLSRHLQTPDLSNVERRIITLVATFCETAHVYPTVLLHADLNPHNIFVDPEFVQSTTHIQIGASPITAIIDWEDALVGDPVYDLANWATFHDAEESDWHYLFEGYYRAADRPRDFDWRFWAYYLRISVSKYVQLQRYGFPDLSRARRRIDRALEALA